MGGGTEPIVNDPSLEEKLWSDKDDSENVTEASHQEAEFSDDQEMFFLPLNDSSRVHISGTLEFQNAFSREEFTRKLLANKVQVRGTLDIQRELYTEGSTESNIRMALAVENLNNIGIDEEMHVKNDIANPGISLAMKKQEETETVCKEGIREKKEDRILEASISLVISDSENKISKSQHATDSPSEQINPLRLTTANSKIPCSVAEKQKAKMHKEIMLVKKARENRLASIDIEKEKILSYRPGLWCSQTHGKGKNSCNSLEVTTLLLVGPKGSGKSTLVNKILQLLCNENDTVDKAAVFHNLSAENGTFFLHEYKVPQHSAGFCIFDSRGLSGDSSKDNPVLKSWIKDGVRHGKLNLRSSDGWDIRTAMQHRACNGFDTYSQVRRKVDFVILVLNALSVSNIIKHEDNGASEELKRIFNCPFLSFKDDKPIVVMTHGDELDPSDRLDAHIFLGELFGISPAEQIFDISDSHQPESDIVLLDMLKYALIKADNNMRSSCNVLDIIGLCLLMLLVVTIIIATTVEYRRLLSKKSLKNESIDWHRIRHLWLG